MKQHGIVTRRFWNTADKRDLKKPLSQQDFPSPFQEAVIKELAQSVENSISWELMGAGNIRKNNLWRLKWNDTYHESFI